MTVYSLEMIEFHGNIHKPTKYCYHSPTRAGLKIDNLQFKLSVHNYNITACCGGNNYVAKFLTLSVDLTLTLDNARD